MILEGLAILFAWLCMSSALAIALITFSNVISTLFPVRLDVRTQDTPNINKMKEMQEVRKTLRTGSDTEVRTMLAKYLE